MFQFYYCLKRELLERKRICSRGSQFIFSIHLIGHLIIDPWWIPDNMSETMGPRHFIFLSLLSNHTWMTKYQPWINPTIGFLHAHICHLAAWSCCFLFGWAGLWLFLTSLLKGTVFHSMVHVLSKKCLLSYSVSWVSPIYIGSIHIIKLLFVFSFVWKRKKKCLVTAQLSQAEGMGVSLRAEFLQPLAVL